MTPRIWLYGPICSEDGAMDASPHSLPSPDISSVEKRPATLSRAYDQKDRYIQSVSEW
jgi:hypothetical protein